MPVVNVLLGLSTPSRGTTVSDLKFYDTSLNDSQKEAIRFAIGAKEIACIHGPPGELLEASSHKFATRVLTYLEELERHTLC